MCKPFCRVSLVQQLYEISERKKWARYDNQFVLRERKNPHWKCDKFSHDLLNLFRFPPMTISMALHVHSTPIRLQMWSTLHAFKQFSNQSTRSPSFTFNLWVDDGKNAVQNCHGEREEKAVCFSILSNLHSFIPNLLQY